MSTELIIHICLHNSVHDNSSMYIIQHYSGFVIVHYSDAYYKVVESMETKEMP